MGTVVRNLENRAELRRDRRVLHLVRSVLSRVVEGVVGLISCMVDKLPARWITPEAAWCTLLDSVICLYNKPSNGADEGRLRTRHGQRAFGEGYPGSSLERTIDHVATPASIVADSTISSVRAQRE